MPSNPHSDPSSDKKRPFYARLSPSILWALLFTVLIGVWALTGDIKGGGQTAAPPVLEPANFADKAAPQRGQVPESDLFRVRTAVFPIQRYGSELIIRGRTFSDTMVDVRAETAGKVLKLPAEKGAFVKKGALLCEMEDGGRRAAVEEAAALVTQTKADYLASKKLEKRGHTAGLVVLQRKAAFDQAKARLTRAKLDLERTKITAPFAGYVEKLPAKIGSLLAVGDDCATVVALDPLRVVGAAREIDVQNIKDGMHARADLVTGETAVGDVRFVSATAEEETRTFRVEIEIANPKGVLKSGVTADIKIKLPEQDALRIPPSILTLNDKGVVGVRVVTSDKKVEFRPVKILSEQEAGIWVKALAPSTSIITVGQDFVKAGQLVIPTDDPQFKGKAGF